MSNAESIFYGLKNKTVNFETTSGKGLCSTDRSAGEQLSDDFDTDELYRVHQVDDEEGVYKFESVGQPGLFIGVSSDPCLCPCGFVLKSALVEMDAEEAKLLAVPPKNGDDSCLSFVAATNPDFYLNSHEGQLWFFSGPLCERDGFDDASSFKVNPVIQDAEKFVDEILDKMIVIKSEGGHVVSFNEEGCVVNGSGGDFKVTNVQPFVYKIESATEPGRFLGIGDVEEDRVQCLPVSDGAEAHLHVVGALCEEEGYISFEPIGYPGYFLCLTDDGCFNFTKGATENASFTMKEFLSKQRYILDTLDDEDTQFRSINGYGISSHDSDGNALEFWKDRTADMGQQIFNSVDDDHWRVHKIREYVYKFESVAINGGHIGVGARKKIGHVFGYECVMQPQGHPSTDVKVIPPLSDDADETMMSFESVFRPGYILNHNRGKLWWLNEPENEFFKEDATWKLTFNE